MSAASTATEFLFLWIVLQQSTCNYWSMSLSIEYKSCLDKIRQLNGNALSRALIDLQFGLSIENIF